MTRSRPIRAFSLIELLLVIAVIAVLAGILLPVVAAARRRSLQAVDVSNMRQLAAAIAMYREDHEYPPYFLHSVDGTYVTAPELYLSPADPAAPFGYWACACADADTNLGGEDYTRALGGPGSYAYVYGCCEVPDSGVDEVLPHLYTRTMEEPHWGILACLSYAETERVIAGSVYDPATGAPANVRFPCYREGPVMRVAADGSLRVVHQDLSRGRALHHFYVLTGQHNKELHWEFD